MKKLLTLITIVFFFASCKKSDDALKNEKEIIISSWISNKQTYTFFDHNGIFLFSNTGNKKIDITFNGTSATDNVNNITENYTFFKIAGTSEYNLSFENNKISELKPLTVSFYENNMDWSFSSTNPRYTIYTVNGVDKQAAKISLRYTFAKK